MPVIICQTCGAEHTAWSGQCPKCNGTAILKLSNTADKMVGRTVKGGFKIIRKLGQGGMGAVYLAEKEGLGHRVALKFLNANLLSDADIARRFLNEAKTYAKIAHPNAITLHDFTQDDDGSLFIAMEFVEGADLKRFIAERKRVAPPEAVEIALQVADVLNSAHGKGIVHRDLKPENIMVRTGMRGIHVKVLDFGIARLLEDGATRLTLQGSIAGTPRYMAPEQVEGKDADARADIYALGVVLFEMLSGVNPFDGATVAEILRSQVVKPMPNLRDISPELDWTTLDEVIQKATKKPRTERYATMHAFAQDLSNAMPTMSSFSALKMTPVPGADVGPNVTPVPIDPNEPWTEIDPLGGARTFVPPGAEPTHPVSDAADGFNKTAYPNTPGAPRTSKMPFVIGAVVAVALVGAVAVVAGKSTPRTQIIGVAELPPKVVVEPPPPKVDPPLVVAAPPPIDNGSRPELLSTEILLKARAAFESGELAQARAIAQVMKEPAPSVAPDFEKLYTSINDAEHRLAQGKSFANRGDCAQAIRIFDGLLQKYPFVKEARSGRDKCKRMLPPSLQE